MHTTLLPFYFKVNHEIMCIYTPNTLLHIVKSVVAANARSVYIGPTTVSNGFDNALKNSIFMKGAVVSQRKIGILLLACDTIELYCFCYSSSLTVLYLCLKYF